MKKKNKEGFRVQLIVHLNAKNRAPGNKENPLRLYSYFKLLYIPIPPFPGLLIGDDTGNPGNKLPEIEVTVDCVECRTVPSPNCAVQCICKTEMFDDEETLKERATLYEQQAWTPHGYIG
jgi:hypothetical protein